MKGPPDLHRIMLIRRKALGDALVTMPAVLEVVRTWPGASVDLVMDRPFAPLLEGLVRRVGGTDNLKVLSWPPREGRSWLKFLRARRYDLVIDWLGSPRTALWTLLTAAPLRVGYDLPRRRWAYNVKVPRNHLDGRDLRGFAGEAFFDPLRSLGIQPAPWRDGFAADDPERSPLAGLGPSFLAWFRGWIRDEGIPVVMMMSATWSAKGWPLGHAADLFLELRRRGLHPVLVAGPGDAGLESGLREKLPDDAFAPPTNLLELAHLLERAGIFVGTDCGPRHLAASLGIPTVTLFGPTDPVGWNPPSCRHVSVRTDIECSPCDLADCPVAGHPCMAELSVDMVVEAVDRLVIGNFN